MMPKSTGAGPVHVPVLWTWIQIRTLMAAAPVHVAATFPIWRTGCDETAKISAGSVTVPNLGQRTQRSGNWQRRAGTVSRAVVEGQPCWARWPVVGLRNPAVQRVTCSRLDGNYRHSLGVIYEYRLAVVVMKQDRRV